MADTTWTLERLPRFPFKLEHEDTLGNVIPNGTIVEGVLEDYGLLSSSRFSIKLRFKAKAKILKYIKDVKPNSTGLFVHDYPKKINSVLTIYNTNGIPCESYRLKITLDLVVRPDIYCIQFESNSLGFKTFQTVDQYGFPEDDEFHLTLSKRNDQYDSDEAEDDIVWESESSDHSFD